MRKAITAAEAMLKRAKVFEGEVVDAGELKTGNLKVRISAHLAVDYPGQRVRIIVVPEAEDGR